ncbi:MAG: hypothetical protein KJO31_11295 [Gammaproteobacteria bacterium]|nr:hypothetical protein [Gammaproteobacteria bacterium]
MSEDLRSKIKRVVVVPGQRPSGRDVGGTYQKDGGGVFGGMDAGSRAGTISTDAGPVPIDIPIPVVREIAMIIGGVSGAYMREVQEFRDALTEDLLQASNQPLRSEALAQDVYHGLRAVPSLEARIFSATTPVPQTTEGVLYVNVDGVSIDVDGKEAILTTTVETTLHHLSDGRDVDTRIIQYQDRDTLSNWTANDNALWHVYANFARHYLGREVSAQLYDRVELKHELKPKKTKSVSLVKKNSWQGESKTTTPTLAWDFELKDDITHAAWVKSVNDANTYFDLEIYDNRTLVYAEEQFQGNSHALAWEIEPCKSYRWSVRPSFHVDGDIRYGEWMRQKPSDPNDVGSAKGSIGSKASEAPAYTLDFPTLDIECGRG